MSFLNIRDTMSRQYPVFHVTSSTQDALKLTGQSETLDSSYLGFWPTDSVSEGNLVCSMDISYRNYYLWTQSLHTFTRVLLLH